MGKGFMRDDLDTCYLSQLADDPAIFDQVKNAFARGVAGGAFPKRPEPTGRERCIYILEGAAVVAFATYYPPVAGRPLMWLDLLWTEPHVRRIGLGRALMAKVKRLSIAEGITELRLGTGMANWAMQGLAKASGMKAEHVTFVMALEGKTDGA